MGKSIVAFFGVVALLTVSAGANADEARRLVPDSPVTLRIVERHGEEFSVEVTNPTTDVASFNRVGLYFVPVGPPEDSPQRLGVVEGDQITRLAPHETLRVDLTTYCLDEHRGSPKEKTSYVLASRRMPTDLANALAGAAHGGRDVQRAVWNVRAHSPTKLIGDSPRDATRSTTRAVDGNQNARAVVE
ncbi:MAG TPA: hypothetical protein VGH87_15095 [Polyangiaceae bacterium]